MRLELAGLGSVQIKGKDEANILYTIQWTYCTNKLSLAAMPQHQFNSVTVMLN